MVMVHKVDDIPFFANKTGNLWIYVPYVDGRQNPTNFTDDIGLQPVFLVSTKAFIRAGRRVLRV